MGEVHHLSLALFSSVSYHIVRVHNIRIERLWVDVTRGFGLKWYNFFMDLEFHCGLDPDLDEHIWLLHHLFLSSIDQDAVEWGESWNSHNIRFDHERDRSPRDMFFFGVLQNGLRGPGGGVHPIPEDVEDPATYGVDWEDLQNPALLNHHNQHNPHEIERLEEDRPSRRPQHLSLVEIPVFACPLTYDQAVVFDEGVAALPELLSRDMRDRRSLWTQALEILHAVS